jgi:hypothetical protein
MIRELRCRHRFAAVGLALLLPPAYLGALAARPPAPVAGESLVTALGEPSFAIAADRVRLPLRGELGLSLATGRAADGARIVELDSRGLAAQPDALVYWSAAPPASESLPADVLILGALPENAVRAYRLPTAAGSRSGSLLVFSLPWQRVLLAQSLDSEAAP